ncbi:MAG TPA: sulfite exporter TauE/SafE family protein, partial [Candidatus Kryptobacter bacterium]|nr:sulfite exporter TauE/SafE family protein [Candidatus Kryptobacter bacterium]
AYGCLTYSLKGRVEIIAAFFMLIGASIGAQIGATAVKYIKGYGIRLLFALMIAFAGCSIALEQIYKITNRPVYQEAAGIVLMGTAVTMTLIIVVRLTSGFRREKRIRS